VLPFLLVLPIYQESSSNSSHGDTYIRLNLKARCSSYTPCIVTVTIGNTDVTRKTTTHLVFYVIGCIQVTKGKQVHVGMEASKTNQTSNTFTPSLHLVPFCCHLHECFVYNQSHKTTDVVSRQTISAMPCIANTLQQPTT